MLCIDKFRSTGKQKSFIAVDAKTHAIITILPGNKNADIKDFFLNHYSKRQRDRVTRVVMNINTNITFGNDFHKTHLLIVLKAVPSVIKN